MDLLELITVGVSVFVVTDIDDLVVLAAFFADRRVAASSVVIGQFLGIGALTVVSVTAALLALVVPPGWTSLLGLIPILLGVRGLLRLASGRSGDDEEEVKRVPADEGAETQILAVALTTIANGGDNLGVYIPLFATRFHDVPGLVLVFALMTALWCGLGYALARNLLFGHYVQRWGHILLPFVLIGIGLHILQGSRVLL